MKIFIGLIAGVVVIATVAVSVSRRSQKSDNQAYDYVFSEERDISEIVTVTGRAVPSEQVDLAFEKSGKVKDVFFGVGDRVEIGDVIVQLEDADVLAQLTQAEANMRAERARLLELERGQRPEEVRVQTVRVENAESALEDAKQGLLDALQDAYTKSDDAVRGKIDSLFLNPRGENPSLSFTSYNTEFRDKVQSGRRALETVLSAWQKDINGLKTSDDLRAIASVTRERLNQASNFLSNVSALLIGLEPSDNLTRVIIDDYKARAGAARAVVSSAMANLSADEEDLSAAESNLLLERQELALKEAGTASEQLEAQGAKLEEAGARVEELKAALGKRQISAPFRAVITKRDIEPGEIASPGANVISLISDNTLMLETFVPEADIAKVELRNAARVLLDAYEADDVFDTRVVFIDPAETVIEGVATYKVKLEFLRRDGRVKPGMTADVHIVGNVKNDVIAIPQRALARSENGYSVKTLSEDGTIKDISVTPGLRGSDGFVEIAEGLEAGVKIITLIRK